jgi:hypothetical protein
MIGPRIGPPVHRQAFVLVSRVGGPKGRSGSPASAGPVCLALTIPTVLICAAGAGPPVWFALAIRHGAFVALRSEGGLAL